MAITLDEPNLLDNVLYYGLFAGAIFQLICIFAVVFIPQSENANEKKKDEGPVPESKPFHTPSASVKRSKKEKKKHR